MGQIILPRWNKLPIVAAIAGSLGSGLPIAGVWYYFSPGYVPTASFHQDKILKCPRAIT